MVLEIFTDTFEKLSFAKQMFFFDTGVTATGKGIKGSAGEHCFLETIVELKN